MIDRKGRRLSAQDPHSAVVVKATGIFSMQGKFRHGSFGDQPPSAVPSRHRLTVAIKDGKSIPPWSLAIIIIRYSS